jgi:hypothetical protein
MSNKIKIFSPLFLFPLTYILGIAITEIFILIFTIFLITNYKKEEIYNKNILLFILLFSLYVALNGAFQISSNLKYSSVFHFRYVLFALAIYLFFSIYEKLEFNKFFFLSIFLFTILLLLFDSSLQFFVGENILGQKINSQGYRVSSFFGDNLILGSFLMRLLPIILWYSFYMKIDLNSKKRFSIFFFALYFFVIYISGERTSFALTLLTIFLIIIFVSNLRYIFIRSFLVFIIFAILISLSNIGKEDITHRMFIKTYKQLFDKQKNIIQDDKFNEKKIIKDKNFNFTSKVKKMNFFSTDHEGHYIIAIELLKKNYIFGVGPKGFRDYCRSVNYDPPKGICSTHPHNILIQILIELGIIGLVFYLVFLFFILNTFFRNFRKKSTDYEINGLLVISIGLMINLFPFFPSGNFFNNWIASFIYFNIGLFLFSYKKLTSK